MPSVDPSTSTPLWGITGKALLGSAVFYPKGWGYPHLSSRWPHEVHYKRGKTCYVPPTEFSLWCCEGPTDCEWIVPGTL